MLDIIDNFSSKFAKALNYSVSLRSGVVVRRCTRMPVWKGHEYHHLSLKKKQLQTGYGAERDVGVN